MTARGAQEPNLRIDLSIDHQQSLKSAAGRLHSEFADTFDAGTIEPLLYSSYDQFAAHATVHQVRRLLAELGIAACA